MTEEKILEVAFSPRYISESVKIMAKIWSSAFEKALQKRRQIVAAYEEYNRIFPCDEKSAAFFSEFTAFVVNAFSKFCTATVSFGFDPKEGKFCKNAPMTVLDLKNYIKEKFQNCNHRLDKAQAEQPNVKRFVSVCEILKSMVKISAEDQSLIFMYSPVYLKGLGLLSARQIRMGEYFSLAEQNLMIKAFSSFHNMRSALCSSFGGPVGIERIVGQTPMFLSRFSNVQKADFWYRYLFDGDRTHAVFNPSQISWEYLDPFILCLQPKCTYNDDEKYVLVKDEFSENKIYSSLLPFAESLRAGFDNRQDGKRKFDRTLCRIALIELYLNGTLEELCSSVRAKESDLLERLKSREHLPAKEKQSIEAELNIVRDRYKELLEKVDKAGFNLDDLLRGEVMDANGNLIKIRKVKQDIAVSPEKQSEIEVATSKDGLQRIAKTLSHQRYRRSAKSKFRGQKFLDGRIEVDEGGKCFYFTLMGTKYKVPTTTGGLWDIIEKLIDWYNTSMSTKGNNVPMVGKLRAIASRDGICLEKDGKKLWNALTTAFERANEKNRKDKKEHSVTVKKEDLFKFRKGDGVDENSSVCYINFNPDLFGRVP